MTGTAVLMLMVSLLVAIKMGSRSPASRGKFRNPFRNMTVMLVMLFLVVNGLQWTVSDLLPGLMFPRF